MLGKHHVSLSILTIAPLLVPLIFIEEDLLMPGVAFLVAVLVGSLTPDSDCGGKATIHYRFTAIDWIMKNIIMRPFIWLIKEVISPKLQLEYEVKEEHRGIMHAPVGILISSIILTLLLLIFMLITDLLSIPVLIATLAGLLIGQFLHLLEDSCTISGINWKFPFSTWEVKGQIYTFDKEEGKKDIRPDLYTGLLGALCVVSLLGFALELITLPLWQYYAGAALLLVILWGMIIWLSKSKSSVWYVDAATVQAIRSAARQPGAGARRQNKRTRKRF